MVGVIVGWFFLGLLFLLLLLLLLPATVSLRYERGAFTARLRVLFLFVSLYPSKAKAAKKRAKRKKRAKPAENAPAGEAQKPAKPLGQRVAMLKRLVRAGRAALYVVLRHLHIRAVDLFLPITADEPAQIARLCGTAQAGIGFARALLENSPVRVAYRRLYVLPDYGGQNRGGLSFSCKVSLSPVIIIGAGVKGLWVFLAPVLRRAARLRRARALARARAAKKKQAGAR